MEDKEHPARTAGRYVRAAGIAIRKEKERLAAESARRAAEAAQAQQAAPPAPPAAAPPQVTPPVAAPPAAAPPQAAPPPPATEQPRAARPHAPPPAPRPILDRLLWWGFLITVFATVLAALNVDMLAGGDSQKIARLVLGGIFITVSLVLLTNWQRANERLVARLIKKFWGMDHPTTRSGRFVRRIAKEAMILLGILWLAIGVFEVLRALVNA